MQEEFENKIEDIIKAQQGDKNVMQYLIESNKGLIWSIVKRFQDRGYELEDLYQIGVMGFIKCIKRFDSNFEVRLSTYAVPYILGEVKRYIRDNGPIRISRSFQEIKIEELSKLLGTSKEEITLSLEAFQPIYSIDEQLGDDENDGLSLLDKMSSHIDEANVLTNKLCIQQAINNLKDNEKQIIFLRYYKGKTQTEIAKIMGITQVQVSRIEKRVLENMRVKLAI